MSQATTAELSFQWPTLGVCRVPYQVFTDPALYACEQTRIFRGDAWHWVGLEVETPNTGDFTTQRIGDTPVIMVRDRPGRDASVRQPLCPSWGDALCRAARPRQSVHLRLS